MHQIRFRLGSASEPAGGTYSAPPCRPPIAGLQGSYTSKRTEGSGRGKRGEKGKRGREGGNGRGGMEGDPQHNLLK